MSAPPTDIEPAKAEPTQPKRSMLALVLSLVLPGLGHAVLGHGRRGALWLAGFVGFWLAAAVTSAFSLSALLVGSLLSVVWYAACAWDASRQTRAPQALRGWGELVAATVVAWMIAPLLVSALIRSFALEAFKVAGGSMCPTLTEQDHVFVDKTAYRSAAPARGDVVVYTGAASGGADVEFLHRVVAIGGDEIVVDEGHRVTVNGEAAKLTKTGELACSGDVFEEELGGSHRIAIDPIPTGKAARLRVPEGHVFVLGDNRANAADSRVSGTLAVDAVRGRVWKLWMRGGGVAWRDVK